MSFPFEFQRPVAALALTAALAFVAPAASAQGAPDEMWVSMVKLGGAMHATAQRCGGYTEAELEDLKQQQRAVAVESGISAAEFEKVFTAAETQLVQRWNTMSPAQQAQACKDIKQQMSMSR